MCVYALHRSDVSPTYLTAKNPCSSIIYLHLDVHLEYRMGNTLKFFDRLDLTLATIIKLNADWYFGWLHIVNIIDRVRLRTFITWCMMVQIAIQKNEQIFLNRLAKASNNSQFSRYFVFILLNIMISTLWPKDFGYSERREWNIFKKKNQNCISIHLIFQKS